ncbi:sensor histidine kinase [Desulfosporosinus lacus]|uniref:histidine kinase n=1 Tax=Desulfosporosinus lacus DSM 15449 TaxID=1121420 RepID=A0A1M6B6R9_9FIRM|nr:ATP-binding protein [Desulfosporosinus lacus]SHI44449.1 two-component system, NarL family, sensor histidine kinase ComP [Desulfosporosinus lacus DSM 15449]
MGNFKKGFVLLILAGTILMLSYYLLFITLNIPYIGMSVEENEAGKWQISYVDHLGWAEQQGIKVGDTVSLINQNQPSEYFAVLQYGAIEQAETFVINKNGEMILHKVTNNMTPQQVQYHIVIPTLVFVILFIFSCVLCFKKNNDMSVHILILFFLAIGLSYLSAGASSRMDTLGLYINRITFSLIPVLFLEFINNYFRRYGLSLLHSRKLLFVFYLINGFLLIVLALVQIFGGNLLIIRHLYLAIFSIGVLLCLYILISRYIRYRNTIHKPVFKIIIVGFTLAFFPFVALAGLPNILFGIELIPGALAAVFLVFMPGVFVYLITANSLFDIDFILDRIRYYSLLTLVPTAIFVLFLFYFVVEFTLAQKIQVVLVTYIGLIAFLYVKEELDFRFRTKLFKEKYNFQASLDRFSQDIAKVMKISDLEERLIMEITGVLSVESIYLLEIDLTDYSLIIKIGSPSFQEVGIIDWFKNNTGLISAGELIDIGRNGVLLILSKEKDKSHLVWIREKLNRTEFNQDERVWLRTIASYASIVYENLHLIEGLIEKLEEAVTQKDSPHPWVLRLLFNLAEKERRRLASDLHDSALQQQLLWYRNLEIISVDERIPVDLKKQLKNMAEGLLDVTHQIRETCNELLPPLLKESGIVEALKNLFANAQLRNDYIVNFNAKDFSINLDYEHVLVLYRIVQELLTNAAKHSKATEINITLANSNDSINFNYRDNGIGMDLHNLQSSLNHIGLSGIKERVSGLEGKTWFYSSLGKGLEVSIWLPINMITNVNEQGV